MSKKPIEREPGVDAPYKTIKVRDAVLANRSYWEKIKRRVTAEKKEPTVQDVVDIMCDEGNVAYYLHDWAGKGKPSPHLFQEKIQKHLPKTDDLEHELSHIVPRAGHISQQELLNGAFFIGMDSGLSPMRFEGGATKMTQKYLEARLKKFAEVSLNYQSTQPDPLSERDKAVYFAAGVYFRMKIDAYLNAQKTMSTYTEKDEFCRQYSDLKHDHKPSVPHSAYFDAAEIRDAPAELLTITSQEWRAIEATALKLRTPKKTEYPKRMQALGDLLDHVGLAYDIKPELKHAVKAHAENHPAGKAFSTKKFKAAQEKQIYRDR